MSKSARTGHILTVQLVLILFWFDETSWGTSIYHRESEHFAPALNESELSDPGARQRYLKRIYHDLLTCPSCSLAAYLPTPDIPSIIDPSPSSRSSWQAELLSLCKVVLLVQAVWSKKNAGVIGVITELEVDDQSVLKEIIESVSRESMTVCHHRHARNLIVGET